MILNSTVTQSYDNESYVCNLFPKINISKAPLTAITTTILAVAVLSNIPTASAVNIELGECLNRCFQTSTPADPICVALCHIFFGLS